MEPAQLTPRNGFLSGLREKMCREVGKKGAFSSSPFFSFNFGEERGIYEYGGFRWKLAFVSLWIFSEMFAWKKCAVKTIF